MCGNSLVFGDAWNQYKHSTAKAAWSTVSDIPVYWLVRILTLTEKYTSGNEGLVKFRIPESTNVMSHPNYFPLQLDDWEVYPPVI